MIKKETIISRFIERFGTLQPANKLKQSSTLPIAIGDKNHEYGITTNLTTCINNFLKHHYDEYGHYPNHQMQIVDVFKVLPDVKFYANDGEKVEVFWTTNRILDGLRVLDNKPFENVQVSYFPEEIMPMSFSRSVEKEIVSVILTPQIIPFKDPMQSEIETYQSVIHPTRRELRWINQLPNTTFWKVQDVWLIDDQVFKVEESVSCHVCHTNMLIDDWMNRAYRDNHPQCRCQCNTYDDFCGCARQREIAKFDRLYQQAQTSRKFARKDIS